MKIFRRISAMAAALVTASAAISLPQPVMQTFAETNPDVADYYETDNNWAKLLQYTLYFYDANMCGTKVADNTLLSWRGNCHTYDAKVPMQSIDTNHTGTNLPASFIKENKDILDPDGDGYIDVSGGFHDAGDHVKFGLPEAYAASVVSWGYYEFRDAYTKTGQDKHVETICRYFCDYFMNSTEMLLLSAIR